MSGGGDDTAIDDVTFLLYSNTSNIDMLYVLRCKMEFCQKNLPLYFTDPVSMPRSIGTKPEMLINSVEL